MMHRERSEARSLPPVTNGETLSSDPINTSSGPWSMLPMRSAPTPSAVMPRNIPPERPGFRSPSSYILSGNVTIPQVYEWNARENPNHALFRYHDGHKINDITYSRAILGIRRAARYVNSLVGSKPECIAIIASTGALVPHWAWHQVVLTLCTDTITYSLTCLGILRAGHTMFLVSPRNVPAAVVDMLRKTNCRHLLVSQDAPIQTLVHEAKKDLEQLLLHRMPVFEDLYPGSAQMDEGEPDDLPKEYDMNSIAMILHSSGMPVVHSIVVVWLTICDRFDESPQTDPLDP